MFHQVLPPNDKMSVVTAIDKLKKALEQIPNLRLAVLFGSTARGTAHARSDLDVGLMLEKGAELSVEMQVALERVTGRPASVTLLDHAPPLLRLEIARDGVVLLARDAHAWANFRAHALIDWWDWAPTARMMHRVMRERLHEEARRGPS